MALFGGNSRGGCGCPTGAAAISRGSFLGRARLYFWVGVGVLGAAGIITGQADSQADASAPRKPAARPGGKAEPDRGASSGRPTGDARALLRLADRGRLDLAPLARLDLKTGVVDDRLCDLLGRILNDHTLAVSVFRTRHSKHIDNDPAKPVSQHYYGQAADVWKVDNRLVRVGHPGARRIVATLAHLDPALRPTEVGSPFGEFSPLPGFFANRQHADHLHLGVRQEG